VHLGWVAAFIANLAILAVSESVWIAQDALDGIFSAVVLKMVCSRLRSAFSTHKNSLAAVAVFVSINHNCSVGVFVFVLNQAHVIKVRHIVSLCVSLQGADNRAVYVAERVVACHFGRSLRGQLEGRAGSESRFDAPLTLNRPGDWRNRLSREIAPNLMSVCLAAFIAFVSVHHVNIVDESLDKVKGYIRRGMKELGTHVYNSPIKAKLVEVLILKAFALGEQSAKGKMVDFAGGNR
jgi:hypothetical protein